MGVLTAASPVLRGKAEQQCTPKLKERLAYTQQHLHWQWSHSRRRKATKAKAATLAS